MTLTSCLRGTSAASVFNMAMQKLSSGTMILFVCVVVVMVAGVKRLRERGSSWVCDEGRGRRVQGVWHTVYCGFKFSGAPRYRCIGVRCRTVNL